MKNCLTQKLYGFVDRGLRQGLTGMFRGRKNEKKKKSKIVGEFYDYARQNKHTLDYDTWHTARGT